MKKPVMALALLAAVALAPAAHADTTTKDCFGRPVPIGQGRPTLVIYANRDTQSQLHDLALPLVYSLREEKPVVVVHVDLSDVPGIFRGLAKGELEKSTRSSIKDMANFFRAHGEQPPPELGSSLFIVGDGDGRPHRALGLPKHFHQSYVQLLDPQGSELARGPLATSGPMLTQALDVSASPQG